MTWVDGYLAGSFRGVPFRTRSVRSAGGRRLVEHVFPERDDSTYEDLGRRNKTFSMDCYVIGDDYFERRNKFIEALDKGGVGRLVHPYWGFLDVRVENWDCTESTDEGRMARFNITFKRVKDIFLTVVRANPVDDLKAAKGNFLDAALEKLVAVYTDVTEPLAVLQDVINIGNQALDVIDQAKKITGAYEEYQAKLDALKGQLVELALNARAIGEDFIDLISFGTDTANPLTATIAIGDNAKTQYNEFKEVTGIQDSTLSRFPSLIQDGYLGVELQKFISRVALGNQAGLVGEMTLENANQAEDVTREIGTLVQRIEEDPTVDDALYETARELRRTVVEVLRDRSLMLDELQEIELPEFEPSLVLSWQRYKTIDREEEIANLNRVLNPGFIPGGRVILVLDE